MTLTVKDLMIEKDKIPACNPSHTLGEVLVELTQKKCGALVILGEDQELQGIFTDGDLRRALQKYGPTVLEQKIGNLMTSTAIFVDSEILAWDAMQQMQYDANKWVMVSPVVKDNKVVGLLRMHDIIQAGLT